MELTVAARSDVGMIRSGNEDSFFAHATKERGIFIVADGMGGHAAGEVASEMSVQIVSRELQDLLDVYGEVAREKVAESLRIANRAIYDRTIQEDIDALLVRKHCAGGAALAKHQAARCAAAGGV